MTYKNIKDIVEHVENTYTNDDVELNSLFFDFNVKATKAELIAAYSEIQHDINGDTVVCLTDINVRADDNGKIIWGVPTKDWNDLPEEYNEIYKGNYMTFLKSFNGRELETGFCRFDSAVEHDGKIGGYTRVFII